MPLHYVLLFPYGDYGWHWGLRLLDRNNIRIRDRLAQRTYYQYCLHTRMNNEALFCTGWLFQQFIVDAWAICNQDKLEWLRNHQANIHADLYSGLIDAMLHHDINVNDLGRRVILPSSYIGGDHFMQQLFQDSMAIVRHFGRPTLFITFTANLRWVEIQ
jgi:Helitron helicase-like domain at N-terminus